MVDKKEKLDGFLKEYVNLVYSEAKFTSEELDSVRKEGYQRAESLIIKPAVRLYEMIKDEINNDSDLGVLIYLVDPPCFKAWPPGRKDLGEVKRNRNLLLKYFNLTSEQLRKRARVLERKLEKKYGVDWFAMAHFPEAY
jgi:hypothetical protein